MEEVSLNPEWFLGIEQSELVFLELPIHFVSEHRSLTSSISPSVWTDLQFP